MPKVSLAERLVNSQMANEGLNLQVANLRSNVEKLEKEVANAKSSASTHYQGTQKLEAELEQIHQFLDAVPNPVARQSDDENNYSRVTRSAMTRLIAWLAS